MKRAFAGAVLMLFASIAMAQVEFTSGPCKGSGIDSAAFCNTLGLQVGSKLGVRADLFDLLNGTSYGNQTAISGVSAAVTFRMASGLQLEAGPFYYEQKTLFSAQCFSQTTAGVCLSGTAAHTDKVRDTTGYVGVSYRKDHGLVYIRYYAGHGSGGIRDSGLWSASFGVSF